jgi:hypothetical protein
MGGSDLHQYTCLPPSALSAHAAVRALGGLPEPGTAARVAGKNASFRCYGIIGDGTAAGQAGKGSTTTYAADERVDAYIDALPAWQQAICRQVRDLVHAADPEVSETIKRSRRSYFVLQGNICALLAARDHVNVFVYDGGIVPDPDGIITAGHDNKTARTVAIRQGEAINAPALSAMFKHIIAKNRAGGWRKLKRER